MSDAPKRPAFGRRKPSGAPADIHSVFLAGLPADMSGQLRELLRTSWNLRDEKWSDDFVSLVTKAHFIELDPLAVSPLGNEIYPVCPAGPQESGSMSFGELTSRAFKRCLGIGIFAAGDLEPDFVFSIGQLIPFMRNGALMPLYTRPDGDKGTLDIPEGTPVIFSRPSEEALPEPVRAAMRKWLAEHHGITDARVCLRADMIHPGPPLLSIGFDFGPMPYEFDEEALHTLIGDLYWYMRPDIAPSYFSHRRPEDYHPL